MYGEGLLTTLGLLISSLAVGGVLALIFALVLTGPSKVLHASSGPTPSSFADAVADTGVHDLLRPGPTGVDPDTMGHGLAVDLLQGCVLLRPAGFQLEHCRVHPEMLAGAIRETNAGEIESAQAFGMSRFQLMLRMVLPSAMRRTLPAYSNEVVMMLHSTSLASAVPAMLDVTAAASRIYSDFYLPFEAYLFAAAIYLCCTFCLIGVFKLPERHFLAHLAPRTN